MLLFRLPVLYSDIQVKLVWSELPMNTKRLRSGSWLTLLKGLAFSMLVLLITQTNASAANISLIGKGAPWVILIEGEIERGDYEKFIDVILQSGVDPNPSIYIASRGGDAIVAMKIGELIRSLKLTTEVPIFVHGKGGLCPSSLPISHSGCVCLSSCVLIYLGGIHRIDNYLGIHRTFIEHEKLKNMTMEDAEKYSRKVTELLSAYLSHMGAPKSLVEKMQSIPSDEIELLDNEYIEKYLSGYAKEYQEWLIAKCGSDPHANDLKVTRCKRELINKQSSMVFYNVITAALENSDKSLIPRHSVTRSLLDKLPFELTDLIGMSTSDAIDALRLVGIAINESPKKIEGKFKSEGMGIDHSLIIGFDKEGKVSSVIIPSLNEKYYRHFLLGMNENATAEDFVKRFGNPITQVCRDTGVCALTFQTKTAELQVVFDHDKSLAELYIDRRGYRDKLLDDLLEDTMKEFLKQKSK
jgi:hypothetical protein